VLRETGVGGGKGGSGRLEVVNVRIEETCKKETSIKWGERERLRNGVRGTKEGTVQSQSSLRTARRGGALSPSL